MTPVVLKLGGSVITDKAGVGVVDDTALSRAASIIGSHGPEALVIVHGGGSFGHPHAERLGLGPDVGTTDPEDIVTVHRAMARLSAAVIDALHRAGVAALPVPPLASCRRSENGTLHVPVAHLEATLDAGFTPVLHGDVIVDGLRGATILSGDELAVSVATGLGATHVGMCTTVPGVFDDEGSVLEQIDDPDAIGDTIGTSDATDVTGGMGTKVQSLATLDGSGAIFDLDGLAAFLAGEHPGTTVGADS